MSYHKVLYKMLISLYLMTRNLKFLGIGVSLLAAAVIVMGVSAITPDAMAQNTTEKGSSEGLRSTRRMQPVLNRHLKL